MKAISKDGAQIRQGHPQVTENSDVASMELAFLERLRAFLANWRLYNLAIFGPIQFQADRIRSSMDWVHLMLYFATRFHKFLVGCGRCCSWFSGYQVHH